MHDSEYFITVAMSWVIEQNTISVYFQAERRPRYIQLLLSAVKENTFVTLSIPISPLLRQMTKLKNADWYPGCLCQNVGYCPSACR